MKRVRVAMRIEALIDEEYLCGIVLEVIKGKDCGRENTEYYRLKLTKPESREGDVIVVKLDSIRRSEWPRK